VTATARPPAHTDTARGLRVDRIPGRTVDTAPDGEHLVLPLWVCRHGRHVGDTDLTLSRPEAEQLLSELAGQLAQWGPK
jgi:hypothetical protein